MTPHQKDCRREARRSAARALWDITNAIHYYRDGLDWQRFGRGHGVDFKVTETADELAASRFAVSDKLIEQAYENAKRAAHWAFKSEEAANG